MKKPYRIFSEVARKKMSESGKKKVWTEAHKANISKSRMGITHTLETRLKLSNIKKGIHFPELRFELSNGRTLCVPCHKETPTYKNRWITKEQVLYV